ncbi:MAG: hypothetical protein ACTHK0_17900 [Ginsengibacter sp.]
MPENYTVEIIPSLGGYVWVKFFSPGVLANVEPEEKTAGKNVFNYYLSIQCPSFLLSYSQKMSV